MKPVSGPKKPCQDLPDFRHVVETIRKSYSDCRLIAIDGLPCSGKTTLAAALGQSLDVNFLHFDDFLLSPSSWPGDIRPLFPFPFFRHIASAAWQGQSMCSRSYVRRIEEKRA